LNQIFRKKHTKYLFFQLNHKLNSLKEEKHGLFAELKKVVSREEEEKKRTEVSMHQMYNTGGHISGMFQTAHNHNQVFKKQHFFKKKVREL